MKPPPFEYHAAGSVDEVLALLAEHGDEAKVLAGGQSLIPLLSLRLARPSQLVDVNRVDDLGHIGDGDGDGGGLRLGAMVRHRALERDAAITAGNPLLAEAARHIGHAAIRHRGTLGGSLAHGDPSAELPAALVAIDGEVEVRSARGSRRIAAADLYDGFLTTTIEPDELLTDVHLAPWEAGAGWSFREFSRRSGDFAVVGVAVALAVEGTTVRSARIALSGMSDVPVRATKAEAALAGQPASADTWQAAAADAAADLDPPTDLHGTTAYRRHLAQVLVRQALTEAHERSGARA